MCYVGSGVLDKILRLLAHSHANSCPLSWYCYPTVSFSVAHFLLLPSVFPSIRVFSNESVLCIRWPKYWSFSFSISPSNEYSWLISIRIDWFDLLAIQGTLKSLLQYTTVQNHQFFGAQPSFWSRYHICTWLLKKTIALTIQAFVRSLACFWGCKVPEVHAAAKSQTWLSNLKTEYQK